MLKTLHFTITSYKSCMDLNKSNIKNALTFFLKSKLKLTSTWSNLSTAICYT